MFRFNWRQFNIKMGLIFMIGTLVVLNLMGSSGFAFYAFGISAMLAWITVVLVPNRSRNHYLWGLLAYLIIGVFLTWLSNVVAPYNWLRLVSIAVVTFLGYLVLIRGAHPFMVAWCLVYWYLLAPLFFKDKSIEAILLGHIVGTGIVICFYFLSTLLSRKKTKLANEGMEIPIDDRPKPGMVISYASIVSLSMVGGVAAGLRWIVSDPTLIANATLNMITPSHRQTWIAAVERVILGTIGIFGGFYCGWYFADPWLGQYIIAVSSFLAFATIYVNISLVVGIIFFLISYSWGAMQTEVGHFIANEKLIGEFVGIIIAVTAIFILDQLQKMYNTRNSN